MPLVSVLIPAYNERFFPAALASALAQTYPSIEIVVCDDSPGAAIEAAVRAAADPRIRYQRNPARLGFGANFTECFRQARGSLIKFLNDDDLLKPQCVAGLAAAFEVDPRVTLATSQRITIDERGAPVQGHLASLPIAHVSCLIPGVELGNFVLINSANFIGEPTTVMFRKRDVQPEPQGLFAWEGHDYHCLADLSLWLRLLERGAAFYQAVVLSEYRVHDGQQQALEGMDVACITERFDLACQARRHGFLADAQHFRAAIGMPLRLAQQELRERSMPPGARAQLEQLAATITRELEAPAA